MVGIDIDEIGVKASSAFKSAMSWPIASGVTSRIVMVIDWRPLSQSASRVLGEALQEVA